MTFLRLVSPEAMVTEDRETSKRFVKNSMHAPFARPSIGGAVKANFSASPTSPIRAFFFARGCTLTTKLTPTAVSRIMDSIFTTALKLFLVISSATLYLGGDLFARPLPKNRRSHAHASRAFLNRNFKIMRHSHREFIHAHLCQAT